jgi:hypothetical protein
MTTTRPRGALKVFFVALPVVIAVVAACSSGGDDDAATKAENHTTTTTKPEDFVMQATDFTNLHDMTPVRGFFVDNKLGHLKEALQVANDPKGGVYPVGTVIQLVPFEAMVKRAPGFDSSTHDWEFFSLDVTKQGTKIVTRGGANVKNRFNGTSCAGCHSAAKPEFDFVCEHDHGCAPLPIGDDAIKGVQESDPRPRVHA